jgi:hypothetical protein
MKSKLLLRIAAGLIFIHLLGHSIGHATWDAPEDGKMQEVVAAMKGNKAEFMGSVKSMGDYYNGYSLMIFGVFGMTILILWFVSGFAPEHKDIARKILFPIGITYVFFGVVEYIGFFLFAAAMSFAAGVLVLVAVAFLNRDKHLQ